MSKLSPDEVLAEMIALADNHKPSSPLTFYGPPNSVKLAKKAFGDSIKYVETGLIPQSEKKKP